MAQVYIFDVLSRLDPSSPSESAFASSLRDKIYAPWALNKQGMPVYSKWKKVCQYSRDDGFLLLWWLRVRRHLNYKLC